MAAIPAIPANSGRRFRAAVAHITDRPSVRLVVESPSGRYLPSASETLLAEHAIALGQALVDAGRQSLADRAAVTRPTEDEDVHDLDASALGRIVSRYFPDVPPPV